MDINLGKDLTTVFTTLICPYISGAGLESTVLGKIVERVQTTLLKRLILGLAVFGIIFFTGYFPQVEAIVDVMMNSYEIPESLGNKTKAYIFLVGIATLLVSVILMVLLWPLNYFLSRRNEDNARRKALFQ